ncbi:LptF/LptG family permease, partial [Candidatus Poribacteria bacterium]|nr:LptF/LptG family permease [Candidatus Poribacteria bacterium]
MNLIDREFIADFLKALALLVFLVCVVVLVNTFLDMYQEIFGGVEHGFYWAFLYYLCILPDTLVQSIAVAAAAAILWVVSKKARQNEILAYLAGGISPMRLAVPLLLCVFAVSIAALMVNEFVVADA